MSLAIGIGISPTLGTGVWSGLPGSSIDLDFANGRYFSGTPANTLSVARASAGLAQSAAGVWSSFANNVARQTDQGVLSEEARTNKCTNFNANPTDLTNVTLSGGDGSTTLTVVDDTAALLAGGLANICTSGKVYRLNNSAGASSAFATVTGTTGGTTSHTVSAIARAASASAASPVVQLSGASGANQALTTGYKRFSAALTPATSSDQLQIKAAAGQDIFFVMNQLEAGAFVTSPVVVAGAAATRAADVITAAGNLAAQLLVAQAVYAETDQVTGTTTNNRIISTGANYVGFSGASSVTVFAAGVSTSVAPGSGTYASNMKSAFGLGAALVSVIANGGTRTETAHAWAASAPFTIGNVAGGTRALNCYLRRLALSPTYGGFDGQTSFF